MKRAIVAALLAAAALQGRAYAEEVWTFSVTPYLWLPNINGTLKYAIPPGGGARPQLDTGPHKYPKTPRARLPRRPHGERTERPDIGFVGEHLAERGYLGRDGRIARPIQVRRSRRLVRPVLPRHRRRHLQAHGAVAPRGGLCLQVGRAGRNLPLRPLRHEGRRAAAGHPLRRPGDRRHLPLLVEKSTSGFAQASLRS